MLLPFYILRYENDLKRVGRKTRLAKSHIDIEPGNECTESDQMIEDYKYIAQHLKDVLSETEQLDLYKVILRVLEYVLPEDNEDSEEVKKIMGGEVWELESKRLIRIGREQGIEQGIERGVDSVIYNMIKTGRLSDREIAVYANCSEEYVSGIRSKLG